jgi:hypothetical protein
MQQAPRIESAIEFVDGPLDGQWIVLPHGKTYADGLWLYERRGDQAVFLGHAPSYSCPTMRNAIQILR